MDFRLAQSGDLPQLKAMYQAIGAQNNLCRWDEIYPCCCFDEDIKNGRLSLLEECHADGHGEIAAAFALFAENPGPDGVQWKQKHEKALYLGRLGVNVAYARQGIGSVMVRKAIALAKEKGAQTLRLFVIDGNAPARILYEKNGFQRLDGMYAQRIDDDLTLHEFAFEIKL